MRFRILVATFLSLQLFAVSCALGQEQEKADDKQPEMLTLQVLVVDPDGYPIENATVFPSGLRTKVEPGSHWGWDEKRLGPPPKLETNAEGSVDLPYPKYVTEEIEVGTVTLSVQHPDFVTFREDRSIDDDPAKIELKMGFRIAATAIDAETGQPIKQDLYGLVSGDSRISEWKLAENGTLISPVFEPNKTWFRLIKIVPGEPHLFSEAIEIDPADRSRVLLRDVKLSKGTRVQGRLDDSIPRPIINGHVSATIVRSSTDENRFNWNSRWYWNDRAPITEDGHFVFESLPPDEVLQMISICDDWVPQNPSKEDILPFFPEDAERMVNSSFSLPQIFRLETLPMEPVLKMIPATSIRVTVLDENNQPLPDVEVMSSPNQYFFDGGSQLLGAANSTAIWLVESRIGGELQFDRTNRFSDKTDKNGVATINTLLPNSNQQLYAFLEGYEMPLEGTRRMVGVELKPDVVNEVTIHLQPAGTDVLKDETFQGGDDN